MLLGQRASLNSFGLIDTLALKQTTVETALSGLGRTEHLHGRAGVPALIVKDGVANYSFTLEDFLRGGATQVHDLSAAMRFNLMRDLCDPAWTSTEVMLPHAVPEDRRPYDRCFRAPIRFDGQWTCIACSGRWQSHPHPAAPFGGGLTCLSPNGAANIGRAAESDRAPRALTN
ncbi:MAG: AraC family transcriptional regulator ligand-binding domain-containing protein [Enhydrobacter sp.]|nr:AraC family transcriptional regulator ligand-binding domain-containing protein [Enhydrobacter sp.]